MDDKNATPRAGVIIVCAGKTGQEAFDFFGEENVICFADNSPAKWNTELRGKRICSPNEIKQIIADSDRPCDIVIGLPKFSSVLRDIYIQLRGLGFYTINVPGDIMMRWKTGLDFLERDRREHPCECASLIPSYMESVERVAVYELAMSRSDEYEQRWHEIRQKYKKICLQKIAVDAIGELLPRYFAMCEENKDEDKLYVKLPACVFNVDRIINRSVLRYVGVSDVEDCLFWRYVLHKHPGEVDLSEMDKYVDRYPNLFPTYFCKANSIAPHFSEDEIRIGEKFLKEMGVDGAFACLSTRNDQYNKNTMPLFDESIYSFRNSNFMDFKKTIQYLATVGISTVKMGRYETPIQDIPNCVDYAGLHSSDFMDLYLFSKCKFAVTGVSGIATLPMLFSKPLLMANAVLLIFGSEGMRYTEHDLMIPKKYYHIPSNRYMTFKEIVDFEQDNKMNSKSEAYERGQIEFHNNTEDEILDAVRELMARIDGTWIDTEEDIANYDRYYELMHKRFAFRNSDLRDAVGVCLPMRPAATFLRKNKFLLD